MKTPFLFNFKQEIPCVEPLSQELEIAVWYTKIHTAAHFVKGHRSRNNKWIPGHLVKGKKDSRKGR